MIPRILHAALAVVVFAAATLPCGFAAPSGDRPAAIATETADASPAEHAHESAMAHAEAGGSEMPCHGAAPEPPPHELTRPCSCGCGESPAGGASVSRLPVAVLPTDLETARPARAPRPPLPRFEAAPGFPTPPDVVPWV